MEIDTTDAIGEAISRYAPENNSSKIDLHLAPQSQYNANPYSEDDAQSTSGDSAQSIDDDAQDDYATPISTLDSRRQSQEILRRSPEDCDEARSEVFATASNEDFFSTSELQIPEPELQSHFTGAAMENTTRAIPSPPAYMPNVQDISIFRHFRGPAPIQLIPEGAEQLPAYEASIQISNVFLRKSEYHTLNTRCSDRKWHRCIATLTGTKLDIHAASRPFYRQLPTRSDLPSYVKQGSLVKSYSMQHAEIGLATDYLKRKFVLRLRVETDQILLSCTEIETLVEWMEKLTWAAAMALELDEREEVKETTLPRALRRRRRRTVATGSTPTSQVAIEDLVEAEENGGAAGEDRLRLQRSQTQFMENLNIEEETAPDPEPSNMAGDGASAFSSMTSTPNMSRAPTPAPHTLQAESRLAPHGRSRAQLNMANLFRVLPRPTPELGRSQTSSDARQGLARYPSTLSNSNLAVLTPSASSPNTRNQASQHIAKRNKKSKKQHGKSDGQEEGKIPWRPIFQWSATFDLVYAKKCMPSLLHDARRKTCWVFHEGERYIVAQGTSRGRYGKREIVMRRVERITLKITEGREVKPPSYEVAKARF